ncbi:MAG TPA: hypothetical protein VGP53_09640 [Acidimicrobiales bacterium]|nr:hypothetical protein [Acidimicrobiales bacterium]
MTGAVRRRSPLDGLFAAAFGLVGLALGARPIGDNSTFVHLRTGIDIVAGRGIPRVDPYSATAAGTDWVVQSWLPSVAYGLAQRLDQSGGALLILNGAITAMLALLVHRLARAGSALRTVGAALVAVAVSGPWWSPRPLLVGLICLALTMLVVESGRRPWLLLPIAWVWVNSHGSFPLAAVWLVATAVGATLDERRLVTQRFRAGLWFMGGLILACANPLGPKLLLFPLTLGERREVFRLITEWRPADFQSGPGLVAAAGLAVALVVVSRRRVPWAAALPAGLFVLLGLVAQRNLAPAGIVLAPALGTALARLEKATTAEVDPSEVPRSRPIVARRDRILSVLIAAAAVLLVANALSSGALNLKDYPVEVVREGERLGVLAPGQLVATQDTVGCYLILRRGRSAGVFIDDRYDMYPTAVSLDYLALLRARPGAVEILDRRGVDAVLWDRSLPLVPTLLSSGWREVAGDRRWVILQRA